MDNNLFINLNEDEIKEFRQWARDNYVPFSLIKDVWHPIVQDECFKINKETRDAQRKDDEPKLEVCISGNGKTIAEYQNELDDLNVERDNLTTKLRFINSEITRVFTILNNLKSKTNE